jgi:hypothetical protein
MAKPDNKRDKEQNFISFCHNDYSGFNYCANATIQYAISSGFAGTTIEEVQAITKGVLADRPQTSGKIL